MAFRRRVFRLDVAHQVANLPPVRQLICARFSAITRSAELLGPSGALDAPGVNADVLTGQTFFPQLITEPFHSGLTVVFIAAAVMMLIGAVASLFNPGRYADEENVDNVA